MPLAMRLPLVAEKWGFRPQGLDEPEGEYRRLLAAHIGDRDKIEALEVSGRRWDEWPTRRLVTG